jgi:hypothetical protein
MCLSLLLLYQSINLFVSHFVSFLMSHIVVVVVCESMRLCQLVTLYWLGVVGGGLLMLLCVVWVACSCCSVVAGCCLILMLLACSITNTVAVASSPTFVWHSIDLPSHPQSSARQCISVVDLASMQCLLLVVPPRERVDACH